MSPKIQNRPEPSTEKSPPKTSPFGLIILLLVILACGLLAWYISTLASSPVPPVGDIINIPAQNHNSSPSQNTESGSLPPSINDSLEHQETGGITSQFVGENDQRQDENVELRPPREGVEGIAALARGLKSVTDAVASFRLSQGRYPETIEELVNVNGFTMPENPYRRGTTVINISPGDFSPGDMSYIQLVSDGSGEPDGFILIAYADRMPNGVTIPDLSALAEGRTFQPPVAGEINGVAVVMYEDGGLADLSSFEKSQNTL